ncbi:MAG: hypothetical protein ACUVQ5_01820 [Candidatus Methanomethylicaceae archaeon]
MPPVSITTPVGYRRSRFGTKKYLIFPFVIVAGVAVLLSAISLWHQVEIQPTNFVFVIILGGPPQQAYTIAFALSDINGTNGPANGYVMVKIKDELGNSLYEREFRVNSNAFVWLDDPIHGGKVIGYSWSIPVENVSYADLRTSETGTFELTFLSFAGRSVSTYSPIRVPKS